VTVPTHERSRTGAGAILDGPPPQPDSDGAVLLIHWASLTLPGEWAGTARLA
jgi:hypothetical protein